MMQRDCEQKRSQGRTLYTEQSYFGRHESPSGDSEPREVNSGLENDTTLAK